MDEFGDELGDEDVVDDAELDFDPDPDPVVLSILSLSAFAIAVAVSIRSANAYFKLSFQNGICCQNACERIDDSI